MANPAAEALARILAAHPEAVVVERGRNNLKHRLADAPDGRQRFALDCSIGPLHYGPNQDQEIDTAFEPSTAPWDWEMTKAGFEVRALSRLDAGQVIEYRSGSEYVRLQPMALQYSNDLNQIQPISMPGNLDVAVDDGTLNWPDGYGPGLDFSWQAQTARLAKRLTIQSLNDLPPVEQFILDGGNPVLELNLIFALSSGVTPYINGEPWGVPGHTKQRETQGLVEFRDGDGNILWWFNLPRSWGAEGEQQLGTFRFKRVGNALYVSHRVPLGFVQVAAYPLTVDVDIDEDVDASEDDGFTTSDGWFYNTQDDVVWGVQTHTRDAFFRWIGISGLSGATIGVAYFSVYDSGTTGTPETDIHAEDAAAPARIESRADYVGRSPTTASVPWDGALSGGDWHNSPSLVSVIQELADSHDSTVIQVLQKDGAGSGTHAQWVRSYDYNPDLAAKLHIEYSVGGVTHEASASLSGSGTATVAGVATLAATASLSGSGSLAVVGTVGELHEGAAVLASEGTLSVLGVVIRKAVLALAGAGALTVAAVATLAGAASISGEGTLSAAAQCYVPGATSIAGEGTLTAGAVCTRTAAASLSGEGTLTVAAVVALAGASSLSGEGTLQVVAINTVEGAASLSSSGSLTAAAVSTLAGVASPSGEGTLAVNAVVVWAGAASLSGEGTLTAAAVGEIPGAASLAGEGTLSVSALTYRAATASIVGEGTLTVAAVMVRGATASLSGEGTIAIAAVLSLVGAAGLAGDGALVIAGTVIPPVPVGPHTVPGRASAVLTARQMGLAQATAMPTANAQGERIPDGAARIVQE